MNDLCNINREIYNTRYSGEYLSLSREGMLPYDKEMVNMRLGLLRKYGPGKNVLDLCCGTGAYLRQEKGIFRRAIGLDFSSKMLKVFAEELSGNRSGDICLIECDARRISLRSETIDFVFSYTSLYHIPQVELAISEMGRVLKSGGVAVFELGNLRSLNTFVCNTTHRTQGIGKPFHIPYEMMLAMISDARLTILEQRAFQILPMWGPTPLWVRPFSQWAFWKRILGVKIGGRMLDERISSCWPLRFFAFRHLFICRKE